MLSLSGKGRWLDCDCDSSVDPGQCDEKVHETGLSTSMGEGGQSTELATMSGRLTRESGGSGKIGSSEGSSCKTSRCEEIESGGAELQKEGLPAGGRSVFPSHDRRKTSASEGGAADGDSLVECNCGGTGGPHSESLLSEVWLVANQFALSRSASVDPPEVTLSGNGTQPRRSSASRSCWLRSFRGGRSPRSRRAASRCRLETKLFGSVGEAGSVDLGARGPEDGPQSPGNVRVDGRDRKAWVPDLEGMVMCSFEVTQRINVGFSER